MRLAVQKRGVSGSAKTLSDQGAVLSQISAKQTKGQSCQVKKSRRTTSTTQLRICLPTEHAKHWLSLPPRHRKQIAGIVFGSFVSGLPLQDLTGLASELRLARLTINNALELAIDRQATLDILLVNTSLVRISQLLGEENL